MIKKPQVSVCIPTYNRTQYLKEAIQSVLDQTFTDFELIVVDNASEEGVDEVVRSFQDGRIRYHRNAKNIGMVGNWNRCIELAQGDYITIFHDDDVMLPRNLERKVQVLDEYSNVGLIHSNIYQIEQNGKIFDQHWAEEPKSDFIENGSIYFKQLVLTMTLICCPSVVVRRGVYECLGAFDTRLTHTVDLEMWLRASLFYDVAYLSEPLVKYRWHKNNETHNTNGYTSDFKEELKAINIVLEKHAEAIPDVEVLQRTAIRNIAELAFDRSYIYYQRHEYNGTAECLRFALQIYPALITRLMGDKRTVKVLAGSVLGEKGIDLMKNIKNLALKLRVSS